MKRAVTRDGRGENEPDTLSVAKQGLEVGQSIDDTVARNLGPTPDDRAQGAGGAPTSVLVEPQRVLGVELRGLALGKAETASNTPPKVPKGPEVPGSARERVPRRTPILSQPQSWLEEVAG